MAQCQRSRRTKARGGKLGFAGDEARRDGLTLVEQGVALRVDRGAILAAGVPVEARLDAGGVLSGGGFEGAEGGKGVGGGHTGKAPALGRVRGVAGRGGGQGAGASMSTPHE